MGLFDCIDQVIRAASNINNTVSQVEEPEKMLEQSLTIALEEMVQLRLYVASLLGIQKRTQQQHSQAQLQADRWHQRACLALLEDNEDLAREALLCKLNCYKIASQLQTLMNEQVDQVNSIKSKLVTLESKVFKARTKKDILKARSQAAKRYEVSSTLSSLWQANNRSER